MTDLHRAVTVYAPDGVDVDHNQLGRLIKAMCDLNGLPVAIELHPQGRIEKGDT